MRTITVATVAVGLLAAATTYSQTKAQFATAAKLGIVHTGFVFLGFLTADQYLWNWQIAGGASKEFPVSRVSNDVATFLQKQRRDIVDTVNKGIKNGTLKQGATSRIMAPDSSLPRPSSLTDFTYAIGGCTVRSYADVSIGKADARGKIVCKIVYWSSSLSDIYKFDKSDQFSLRGYAVFPAGELYGFERAGLAKQFAVTSGPFYSSSLLGSFEANR